MRSKRIYLNEKKTKYCIVKLFKRKKQMQDFYFKSKPDEYNHYECLGVHMGYERWTDKGKIKSETGTVLLSLENCGAGIVSHELMHAVLWAWHHKKYKRQYPIIIKNMRQEEYILHQMTYAIVDFYDWYWKIKKFV